MKNPLVVYSDVVDIKLAGVMESEVVSIASVSDVLLPAELLPLGVLSAVVVSVEPHNVTRRVESVGGHVA